MNQESNRNPNLSVPVKVNSVKNEIQEIYKDTWWTGISPEKCCGYNFDKNYLQALPLLNLDICSRQDILDYFDNTWTLTEILFSSLKTEKAFKAPPYHNLRHPLIFYYGHTAVLFVNKLRLARLIPDSVDSYLENILETGVDEMSWDDMSKNEMNWPAVSEVHGYRKKVYQIIKNLILNHPDLENDLIQFKNNKQQSPFWALWMGIEHEKIHFETSSVLIRELPIDYVEFPKFFAPLHPSSQTKFNLIPKKSSDYPENEWVGYSKQIVNLGKKESEKSYGWDNEYGHREIELKDFKINKSLISNGEFYEFVSSGAYIKDHFWTQDGLNWRKFRNTKRPAFWMNSGPDGLHEYKLRTLFKIIEMPWSWPVEVNHYEANAFCNWKKWKDNTVHNYRLSTEAEFIVNRKFNLDKNQADPVIQKTSMKNNSDQCSFNFNFAWSSPCPVSKDPIGNLWQLVEDQFNPLENFQVHPYYDDFSTPCFDGKHHMIMGGSFISCGSEASIFARFHFRPHFLQHSGFRIAYTLDGSSDNNSFKIK